MTLEEAKEVLVRYLYDTPLHRKMDLCGITLMEFGVLQWEVEDLFQGEFKLEYDGSTHPDWEIGHWRLFWEESREIVPAFRLVPAGGPK